MMFFDAEAVERRQMQAEADTHALYHWLSDLDQEDGERLLDLLKSIRDSHDSADRTANFYVGYLVANRSQRFDVCGLCSRNHLEDPAPIPDAPSEP